MLSTISEYKLHRNNQSWIRITEKWLDVTTVKVVDLCNISFRVDEHSQSVLSLRVMKTKHFWLFFLRQVIVNALILAADDNCASRSAFFATRENNRLDGYVVKWFESPSFISCSQSCLRNTWCSSTNFKMFPENDGKGTCELNKHDSSLINENTNFYEEEDVTFSMLLKVGCIPFSEHCTTVNTCSIVVGRVSLIDTCHITLWYSFRGLSSAIP